jgi:hypothetical protein
MNREKYIVECRLSATAPTIRAINFFLYKHEHKTKNVNRRNTKSARDGHIKTMELSCMHQSQLAG